jgi:hypothetical protein
MTSEPKPSPSAKKYLWILVIVLGAVALGLDLASLLHKQKPWSQVLNGVLLPGGLIFMAWSNLLPERTGLRRVLLGLAYACILVGLGLSIYLYSQV